MAARLRSTGMTSPTPAQQLRPSVAVIGGFIVHNDRTYPWLRKLFAESSTSRGPSH